MADKTYIVLNRLKRNGEVFERGSEVKLSEDEARVIGSDVVRTEADIQDEAMENAGLANLTDHMNKVRTEGVTGAVDEQIAPDDVQTPTDEGSGEFNREALEDMTVKELEPLAEEQDIDVSGMKKAEMIDALLGESPEDEDSE